MKIVIILILIAVTIFISLAAFFATKRFVRDVIIIIMGEKYIGVCTSKFGFKRSDHLVEWTDSESFLNKMTFPVTTFREPPFEVSVYSIGNDPKKSNLGIISILYYFPVVILTDFTFLALIFGAIPEYLGLMF